METYFAIHDVEIKKFREEEDKKGRARRGSIDFSNPSTATSNTNIFAQSEKVIVAMTRGEKKLFVDAVHEDSPTTIPYKFFRLVNNISISDSQARCQEQRKIILKLFKAKPDKTWREQVDYVPASQLRMSGVHGSSKSSKSSKSSSSYKSSKSTRESSKGQENAGADVVYSRKNKVEVNYKGRGRWYSGTVTGKHTSSKTGNTTYTIKFDDGNLDHHFLEDESLMERNYDMVKESEFNNTVRGFFIENVVDQARICITGMYLYNKPLERDGYYLYIAVFSVSVEWCVRKLLSSSIISYSNTSISHSLDTNIHPSTSINPSVIQTLRRIMMLMVMVLAMDPINSTA